MFNPALAEQPTPEHALDLHRAAADWRRTTAASTPHRARAQARSRRGWFASVMHPRAIGCEA